MWGASFAKRRIVVKANPPFVFAIRENETESILFIGRVVVPGS